MERIFLDLCSENPKRTSIEEHVPSDPLQNNLDTLKYIAICKQNTAKNNLGVLSFVLAAIGFILIILSFMNIKSSNYQYYTETAFALLVASIISGAIAKRKAKQAKPET